MGVGACLGQAAPGVRAAMEAGRGSRLLFPLLRLELQPPLPKAPSGRFILCDPTCLSPREELPRELSECAGGCVLHVHRAGVCLCDDALTGGQHRPCVCVCVHACLCVTVHGVWRCESLCVCECVGLGVHALCPSVCNCRGVWAARALCVWVDVCGAVCQAWG